MKNTVSVLSRRICRLTLATTLALVICVPLGCQKKVEKTTDPDKMEKIRQEHLRMSQREMQQSREAERKRP